MDLCSLAIRMLPVPACASEGENKLRGNSKVEKSENKISLCDHSVQRPLVAVEPPLLPGMLMGDRSSISAEQLQLQCFFYPLRTCTSPIRHLPAQTLAHPDATLTPPPPPPPPGDATD